MSESTHTSNITVKPTLQEVAARMYSMRSSGDPVQDAIVMSADGDLLCDSLTDYFSARTAKVTEVLSLYGEIVSSVDPESVIESLDQSTKDMLQNTILPTFTTPIYETGDSIEAASEEVVSCTALALLQAAAASQALEDAGNGAIVQLQVAVDEAGAQVDRVINTDPNAIIDELADSLSAAVAGSSAITAIKDGASSSAEAVSSYVDRLTLATGGLTDQAYEYARAVVEPVSSCGSSVRERALNVVRSLGLLPQQAATATELAPPSCALTDVTGKTVYSAFAADLSTPLQTAGRLCQQVGSGLCSLVDTLFGPIVDKTKTAVVETGKRLAMTKDTFCYSPSDTASPCFSNFGTNLQIPASWVSIKGLSDYFRNDSYTRLACPSADVYLWRSGGRCYMRFNWKPIPDNVLKVLNDQATNARVESGASGQVEWWSMAECAVVASTLANTPWDSFESDAQIVKGILYSQFYTWQWFNSFYRHTTGFSFDVSKFWSYFYESQRIYYGLRDGTLSESDVNNHDLANMLAGKDAVAYNVVYDFSSVFFDAELQEESVAMDGLSILVEYFSPNRFGCYSRVPAMVQGQYSLMTDSQLSATFGSVMLGVLAVVAVVASVVILKKVKFKLWNAQQKFSRISSRLVSSNRALTKEDYKIYRKAQRKVIKLEKLAAKLGCSVKGAIESAKLTTIDTIETSTKSIFGLTDTASDREATDLGSMSDVLMVIVGPPQ